MLLFVGPLFKRHEANSEVGEFRAAEKKLPCTLFRPKNAKSKQGADPKITALYSPSALFDSHPLRKGIFFESFF